MTPTDPALVEARLRALARACADRDLDAVDAGLGAGRAGDEAFYLADDDPRAVGRALFWARAAGSVSTVHLLGRSGVGDLARRAVFVGRPHDRGPWPEVRVWAVDGAGVAPAEPGPVDPAPDVPGHHLPLAAVISEAGARPVNDRGLLVAEVAGLEVGRVVDTPDGPTIDVGVGQADRELNVLVHGADDPGAGLRRVIAAVAEYRSTHSHHPLTRVARERWLRSWLLDDPSRVGATALDPLPPLRARSGLLAPEPAAVAGTLESGRPVVAVAMVGSDLDLVPEAADHRHRHDPDARLVVLVPERDVRPGTDLVGLVDDATVQPVRPPWQRE